MSDSTVTTDWTRATAAEMADALAAGEVTSVALVQAHLDRPISFFVLAGSV